MSTSTKRAGFGKVLLDLNTQCDYLLPTGASPVGNRKDIIANIRRLMEWSRTSGTPVISSLNSYKPHEHVFGAPRHCIDHTPGQRKLPFTLLPRRILLQGDNTFDLPFDIFRRYRQVIFAKRSRDLLGNPKADRLLTELPGEHYVVFGVLTEHCIKSAVLALLARHRNVAVVRDACGHWNSEEADLALRQMDAKGAVLLTTDEVINNVPIPVRVVVQTEQEGDADGMRAVEHALAARRGGANGHSNGGSSGPDGAGWNGHGVRAPGIARAGMAARRKPAPRANPGM